MGSESVGKSQKRSILQAFTGLICGYTLGIGVGLGGMTDARKSSAFFNIANWGTEYFDPALLITFVSGFLTNAALYHMFVLRSMQKPLFADRFCIPQSTELPFSLFVGSFMFGTGWALGGFCPGPALVAAVTGEPQTLLFIAGMVFGMYLGKQQDDAKTGNGPPGTHSIIASQLALLFSLAAIAFAIVDSERDPPARGDPTAFYQSPVLPAIGGALVGLSVAMMMALSGDILGISGIVNGLFSPQSSQKFFRIAFVAGLLSAGATLQAFFPQTLDNHMQRPRHYFVVGGMLVGYGTTIGRGCTSGHGIAGLGRLSNRSIAAVLTFMTANLLVTTSLRTFGIGVGWQEVLSRSMGRV